MHKMIAIAVLSATVLTGCDPFGNAEKESERVRKEREERNHAECENLRRDLKTFVNSKCSLYESEMKKIESSVKKMRDDSSKLSTAVSAVMDGLGEKGEPLKYESKILRLLKDKTINDLATEYCSSDYSSIVVEYMERVRLAMLDERRYRQAISESDEIYANAIKETRKWTEMTQTQRDNEVVLLEKEIKSLEQKQNAVREDWRNLTRRGMQGGLRLERERKERADVLNNRIGEIQNEIDKKRRQLDYLRHPEQASKSEARAANNIQELQRRADENRRQRLSQIDERIKPAKSVADIVTEYEAKTIGKLRDLLSQRIAENERSLDEKNKNLVLLRNTALAIPLATKNELDDLRRKLIAL